jgi:hypothetical protein
VAVFPGASHRIQAKAEKPEDRVGRRTLGLRKMRCLDPALRRARLLDTARLPPELEPSATAWKKPAGRRRSQG